MESESDNDIVKSDYEVDDEKHSELVQNIVQLTKRHPILKPTRTEPSIEISEFHWVHPTTCERNLLDLGSMVSSLQKTKSKLITKDVLDILEDSDTRVLDVPLHAVAADRIQRKVAYKETVDHLNQWESIIEANKVKPTLIFSTPEIKKKKASCENFRVKSALNLELEALERGEIGGNNNEDDIIKLDEDENESDIEKFPLTKEEMLEKREEASRLRAKRDYYEMKLRRQNKIKSKSYRRIRKRERIKKQMEEFEKLQKDDPEAALDKLDDIERTRTEERMTLRHGGEGKWAQSMKFRAKYNKEARQALAEQLTLSKELREKNKTVESDSDSDSGKEFQNEPLSNKDQSNPWFQNKPITNPIQNEVEVFTNDVRNYFDKYSYMKN